MQLFEFLARETFIQQDVSMHVTFLMIATKTPLSAVTLDDTTTLRKHWRESGLVRGVHSS